MSEFSLSQDILPADVYDAVVKEIEGNDLLAAVENSNIFERESSAVTPPNNMLQLFNPRYLSHIFPAQYDSYPDRFIKSENIKTETADQPTDYSEDQKNFVPWQQQQHYEQYPEGTQIIYPPPTPIIVPQIPANVDYAGQLDFDILITSHTANRNSWIYSATLNKVFINMQNILPVDVKRNVTTGTGELYLRATLLYSLPQYAQDLVERCSTHIDPRLMSNRDTDPHIIRHVLRCTNPGSVYMGNTERKEHLSVVTQLAQPQAGVETVRVNYQFMCKNSCPSGMNRRAVDVIFTLEDAVGQVLGRRKLSVRVCSCPKRDKEKEEKEYYESLQQQHPVPHGRKRKMARANARTNAPTADAPAAATGDDCAVFEVPSFRVVGHGNYLAALKGARDGMVVDVHYNRFDNEKEELAKECIHKLNALIKKATTSAPPPTE